MTHLTLWNTIFWLTIMTVGLRLFLGLAFAQLLNSEALRRWHLLWLARSMVLIPWVTPPVVAVAAWKWMLHPRFGAINQILLELGDHRPRHSVSGQDFDGLVGDRGHCRLARIAVCHHHAAGRSAIDSGGPVRCRPCGRCI